MTARKNITATVTTKKDVYYIIISYYSENGIRKQKWIKTDLLSNKDNKRKIEQKRVEILQEWQSNRSCYENQKLFSDFLKQWLEENKHTISKSTYHSYKQTIYNSICPFFETQKINLCELSSYHIHNFYVHKINTDKVTANTIHHYHANIHKALNFAVKIGLISHNPANDVELPKKVKHNASFYSVSEINTLLDYVKGSQLEVVIMLACWFGLRRGEIIGIKWSDIDFENKILHITGTVKDKGESGSKIENLYYEASAKTSSSIRSFPIPDIVITFLKELKTKQDKKKKNKYYNQQWLDFVCVKGNGDLIPLEYISRTFPKICEKAGLKRLKFHELRHTNISLLLEAGANMKELQEWAGHSSYSTTANIYSHIQIENKTNLTKSLEKIIC